MKTGRERLEALANLLETHDFGEGKFHLAGWMLSYEACSAMLPVFDPFREKVEARRARLHDDSKIVFHKTERGEFLPIDCKTVGCAVGWGITLIPEFREAGLRFAATPIEITEAAGIVYGDKTDIYAAAHFFEIHQVEAHRLFLGSSYQCHERSDPKAVAKRIRELLESKS